VSSFVLVHGSWHGGWCWKKLVPLLREAGHRVVAPDLPGHGADGTARERITMDCYAERIQEHVSAQSERVLLVGHSMGGGVISRVAEICPDLLRALVYLAAYIPEAGHSVADRASTDRESRLSESLKIDWQAGIAELDADAPQKCFYADCSSQDIDFARAHLCQEPLVPLTDAIAISEARFERVPRYYIECLRDETISPALQRRMYGERACREIFSLDTGHSPFFCAPERLAAHLIAIAERS